MVVKNETFIIECNRLAEIVEQYRGECQLIYERLKNEAVREKFAVGGEKIHRGFYCPSPIIDVVGNANRGKLLKRLTARSKPTYRYSFDRDGRLIIAEHGGYKEIIIRRDDVETGILFTKKWGIYAVSECIYNGEKIQSYVFGLYDEGEKCINEYSKETYEYSENGLETVDWRRFSNYLGRQTLEHEKYHFSHKDGYLSQYKVVEYDGDTPKDSVYNDRVFDVYVKRLV